jgi:DNA-binding MarR family transcriptional regulator
VPIAEERVSQDQQLLSKLSRKPCTEADLAPKKITKSYQQVGLTDKSAVLAAVADLIHRGFVVESKPKGKRSKALAITEAGAAYLASLPAPAKPERKRTLPAPPPPIVEDPILLPHQKAFLLLQPLNFEGKTLTDGEANAKLTKPVKDALELDGPLASQLRRKLAEDGFLRAEKAGRSLHLTLTDAGLARLITLPHHTGASFTVTGLALNELVKAASNRPGAEIAAKAQAATEPRSGPGNGMEVGEIVYATLQEFARERHSRTGLVPIFEVRREIALRLGPDAARHDALDQIIMDLWKKGRIRLISISDLRTASQDELADSISDSYETLFYMEDTDGHHGKR